VHVAAPDEGNMHILEAAGSSEAAIEEDGGDDCWFFC